MVPVMAHPRQGGRRSLYLSCNEVCGPQRAGPGLSHPHLAVVPTSWCNEVGGRWNIDEVICRRRGQEELADESALRDAIAGPICLALGCINIRRGCRADRASSRPGTPPISLIWTRWSSGVWVT